jgi:hypothetical protein
LARSRRESLKRQLLAGELRVGTTYETLSAACKLEGVEPPPQLDADKLVLLSVMQFGGATLTQIHPLLSRSRALPVAWKAHARALEAALQPLDRLEAWLRRFGRYFPSAQWVFMGATLVGGGALAVEVSGWTVFWGTLSGAATLAQWLLRSWLRRHAATFLMERLLGPADDEAAPSP